MAFTAKSFVSIIMVLAMTVMLVVQVLSFPREKGEEQANTILIRNCSANGTVALTFDDGPSEYTDIYLDTLDRYHIKASFFVLGCNIYSQRVQTLRRTYNSGHTIGSHSYNHPDFLKLNNDSIMEEIRQTDDIISSVIGFAPRYLRPPYGNVDSRVESVIASTGKKIVLWNIDTDDWKDAKGAPDRVKNARELGSTIVLMHDLKKNSSEVLPQVIDSLLKQNLRFVTIDECLK